MTNVAVGGGDFIAGIRKNEDLGREDLVKDENFACQYDMAPVRPLRYTPGLKCDAHLESLRPTRDPKNPPMQVIVPSIIRMRQTCFITLIFFFTGWRSMEEEAHPTTKHI